MLPVLWCGRRLERVVTRGSSVRTWPSALALFSTTSTALGHLLLGLAGPARSLLLQATPATRRLLLELGSSLSWAPGLACAPAFRGLRTCFPRLGLWLRLFYALPSEAGSATWYHTPVICRQLAGVHASFSGYFNRA